MGKSPRGRSKAKGRDKNSHQRRLKSVVPIAAINLTANYSNNRPQTQPDYLDYKSLLPQYQLPYITYLALNNNKKNHGIPKYNKKSLKGKSNHHNQTQI